MCCMPRDGSVIFWQDGFLVKPIMKNTGSDIVHCAIVLYENNEPYVWEATWPRVQKTRYSDYIAHLQTLKIKPISIKRGFKWFILQPVDNFTHQQLEAMKQYARSQLGRPYMLRGYWQNREVSGIFCSQYVSNCVEKSGRIQSANFKESPVSLKEKLKELYE